MQVKWAAKARKDLEQIVVHVRKNFSEERARKIRTELFIEIGKLSDFPQMGKIFVSNVNRRFLIVEGNLVFYEIVLDKDPFIVIVGIRPRKTGISRGEP